MIYHQLSVIEIIKKTIEKCNINITKLTSCGNCDKRKKEFDQLMLCMQKNSAHRKVSIHA